MVFNATMHHRRPAWWLILGSVLLFALAAVGAGNPETARAAAVQERYPDMDLGVLSTAELARLPDGVLVVGDGLEITRSDIRAMIDAQPDQVKQQLEHYTLLILKEEAARRVLTNEAAKAGLSAEGRNETETIQALLRKKAGTPDASAVGEAEIEAFYRENREMMGGASFETVRGRIRQYLLQEKQQQAVSDYIESLGETAELRIDKDWTADAVRRVRDNPVDRARQSGKPSMIEFGATGCIPCDRMQPILDKVRKKYGDALNVVFVHVRENPILGSRFGIRSIPVQVFYDKDGKETFRHTGFYAEAEVMKQIEKLGVETK